MGEARRVPRNLAMELVEQHTGWLLLGHLMPLVYKLVSRASPSRCLRQLLHAAWLLTGEFMHR